MLNKKKAIFGMIVSVVLFLAAMATIIVCKYIGYWWDAFFMRTLVAVAFLSPATFALCLFSFLVVKKRESKSESYDAHKNHR